MDVSLTTVDPATDMRERLLPHPTTVRLAEAVLRADPVADVAFVPMILPGKRRGIWFTGQEVRTVHGAVFVARSMNAGELPEYGEARDMCCAVARQVLGSEPGTVAYALVERDGRIVVFEDR